jgi:hypothetical protein
MRYRLIPSRWTSGCWHVEGSQGDAYAAALSHHENNGIPVLVFEAPVGSPVRYLDTVGSDPKPSRPRRATTQRWLWKRGRATARSCPAPL